MTLVELIVVLVILVVLAGILIPLLPNMIGRTHHSAGATNTVEVNKFVQIYEQSFSSFPQDLDALTDTPGTAIPDYIPSLPGQLSVRTLSAVEAATLARSGITTVAEMYPNLAALGTRSPTFAVNTGTRIAVGAGLKVIQVSEATVELDVGMVRDDPLRTGDVYVAFGLGKFNTMIGKVMSDPPLHFGEGSNDNPNKVYSRYALIFRIARGNGTGTPDPLSRAVFVGSAALHETGLVSTDAHLQGYYDLQK